MPVQPRHRVRRKAVNRKLRKRTKRATRQRRPLKRQLA